MRLFVKIILVILATFAIIAIGLFWPEEETVTADPFRMEETDLSYNIFRTDAPALDLSGTVSILPIVSSKEDILSGRFQYSDNMPAWRFTTPIDWSNAPSDPRMHPIIEQLALADPFLESFAKTREKSDFDQIIFFLFDWQSFYQDGLQYTAYTWDETVARQRIARLAYILSEIRQKPDLLAPKPTQQLISLADFHVQRLTDPVYGTSQDTILQTPELKALCSQLSLPACRPENKDIP